MADLGRYRRGYLNFSEGKFYITGIVKKEDYMAKDTDILQDIDKDTRIKKELSRLNNIFKNIEDGKKKTVKRVIENVAFMAITLQDLQEVINQEGCISRYQNGANQWGYKESVAIGVYNKTIKNYMTAVNKLIELLPPEEEEEDEFLRFIRGNGKN